MWAYRRVIAINMHVALLYSKYSVEHTAHQYIIYVPHLNTKLRYKNKGVHCSHVYIEVLQFLCQHQKGTHVIIPFSITGSRNSRREDLSRYKIFLLICSPTREQFRDSPSDTLLLFVSNESHDSSKFSS